MANLSTTNTNSIYKYTAQIETTFEGDSESTIIENMRFKYIVNDYNYDEFNFPLIYCYVNLTIEQQEKFVENQKTGTLVFTLQKYIENSDMPGLKVNTIQQECIYFISGDAGKNKERIIDEDKTQDLGDNFVIGLIALDHINKLKKVMNMNITQSSSMTSVVCNVLEGHTLLIEPFDNNNGVENLSLPPINSITKVLRYLNNYQAFYNTPYRFFMDFDTTYLMSSSGRGLVRRGETCNDIKINIRHNFQESNMEGMYQDKTNNMYILDCSGTYTVLSDTTDSSRSFSAIGGVTVEGDIEEQDTGLLDSGSPILSKTNMIRIPNGNTTLITNMTTETANNAVTLTIAKNKIDASILTPNRHYVVECGEVYDTKYDGNFLLSRKRELYLQEGEGLAMSAILYMKKVAAG